MAKRPSSEPAGAQGQGKKPRREPAKEVEEDSEEEEEDEELQLTIDVDGRVASLGGPLPNYSFRSFPQLLPVGDQSAKAALATLVGDCEKAFTARATAKGASYSRGETFWVPAGAAPESLSAIERLALAIFHLHVPKGDSSGCSYDASRSGAEWWTQVIETEDDIGWHWDRDYGLEADEGLRLHPHIATVTYLSEGGAPTIVLEAVEPPEGDGGGATRPLAVERGHLSWPQVGKHISFDGRWLHAAPADLASPVGQWAKCWQEACDIPGERVAQP
ncbi:unnamed protein product [Polarella glacialis]|uniref:Uncharacterized protein n=1 Tax=Polarella glacialis TaxID=89957 RepID=A0A813EE87_POLGL|nr:unnamed protein product [Polarella glacialis]